MRRVLAALVAAALAVGGLAGARVHPAEAQEPPGAPPSFVVANSANNSVTAYAAQADGDVAPVARISGLATRLSGPTRVVFDGAGRMFVFNRFAQTVTAYPAGANGNVAPSATVPCCSSNPGRAGLAVFGDRLYLADALHAAVRPYAIGPTGGLTPETWLSGPATGLTGPDGIAFDASGHLYVANFSGASITTYAPGATGNTAPVATIAGPATGLAQPSALAIDQDGRLYVADWTIDAVNVFAPGANGNAAPVATISGPSTGLDEVGGLAIDGAGRLLVTSRTRDSVNVYAPGATGDAAPIATIAGPATGLDGPEGITVPPVLTITGPGVLPPARPGEPYTYALTASGGTTPRSWSLAAGSTLPAGLVLGADGVISGTSNAVGTTTFSVTVTDAATGVSHRATRAFSLSVAPDAVSSFYVASTGNDSITLHSPGADGDRAPVATIAGPATGLRQPSGLLIDGAGRLYSANYLSSTVTAYAPDAQGDAAPVITIAGPSTGLRGPSSMALDSAGRLYVSNYDGDSVTVYAAGATGDASPMATISGPATGLSGPSALAFDSLGRLVVGNVDNDTVTMYAPGAAGDVAPLATLAGPGTGLDGPSGMLVDATGALLVANISVNTVTKYASGASGNAAPIATIAGPQTGFGQPRGLALDGSGRLIVTNQGRNMVTQYAPGVDGDVAPVASLYGPATGLGGPFAIVVVPPNRAPECVSGSVTTPEDTAVSTRLSCTDADADSLTYTIVSGPSNGILGGTAPDLTYTPDAGYAGPDSFTYKANDGTDDSNVATVTITVTAAPATFEFSGFFAPVDNPPVLNAAKAGAVIPVKFSLGGDQGLAIFAAGYPGSRAIPCDTSTPIDTIEATLATSTSGLSYDATSDRYTYAWRTNKAWAGTCRQLVITLTDGTSHTANFRFK